jgi:hypothetical protein
MPGPERTRAGPPVELRARAHRGGGRRARRRLFWPRGRAGVLVGRRATGGHGESWGRREERCGAALNH